MTSPISPTPDAPRFRGLARTTAFALAAASIALAGAGGGCQKKKKAAPPPPPPPKPVAVIPDPIDTDALIQTMKADARVQFPKDRAPADRSLAEGVIHVANYVAKGDASGLKACLGPKAQTVLDDLVSSGGWAEGTQGIEQVRVVSLSNTQDAAPTDSTLGLAVQGKDGAYLLAWTAHKNGDTWTFESSPCQGDVKPRASEFDGVSLATNVELGSALKADSAVGPDGKPSTNKPEEAAPEKAKDPFRKNTPAGPINIPHPGGS